MKQLQTELADAITEYRYRKQGTAIIDDDTDFEIHNEVEYFIKHVCEEVEELDSTIDAIIEEQNEPNLHEWDIQEDNRRRYENMTGGI